MGIACLLALAALLASCTSHAFAQKTPDGSVYVNSSTSFLFFSSSDIKKCTESGMTLTCKKMTVVDSDDSSSDDDDKPKARKHSRDDDSDSDSDDDKPKKKKSDSDDSDDDSKKSSKDSDDD